MKRTFSSLFLVILVSAFARTPLRAVDLLPGSQLTLLGSGASGLAMGGSGITRLGTIEGALYNPAVAGNIRRVSASISGGGFGTENGYWYAGGAIPTLFGVWSFGGTLLTSPQTFASAGTSIALNGALSKRITDALFVGVGLKGSFGTHALLGTDFGIAGDLGVYFKSVPNVGDIAFGDTNNVERDTRYGFGIYDLNMGMVLRNIGKIVDYNKLNAHAPLTFAAGISANLLNYEKFYLKPMVDIALPLLFNPVYTFALTVNAGLEFGLFDMIYLRAGFPILALTVSDVPFTAGIGGKFSVPLPKEQHTDVKVDLAYVPQSFNGKKEHGVHFTVGVGFGSYDSAPPTIAVSADHAYFSPNFDGVQDTLTLRPNISDSSMVMGWRVDISDAKGTLVKSFESEDLLRERLTIASFAKKLISSERAVDIPSEIVWDGIDLHGTPVNDGTYTYTVSAWDRNDNTNITEPANIYVDRIFPALTVTVPEKKIFSPNGDGRNDTFLIEQDVTMKAGDALTVEIFNAKGELVRIYTNTVNSIVRTEWDGKDSSGKDLPEGEYTIRVRAAGPAGNAVEEVIENVRLVRAIETVSARADAEAFSPNGDGVMDLFEIALNASSTEGLISWRLPIINERGTTQREFKGSNTLPDMVIWYGLDDKGAKLPDGTYTFFLELAFESGNAPVSKTNTVNIDTTAPSIALSTDGNIRAFSPDGDGVQDTIDFIIRVADAKPNDQFTFTIRNDKNTLFYEKTYATQTMPERFSWNGKFNNNPDESVAPDGTYTFMVVGADNLGNTTTRAITNIRLDTGIKEVDVDNAFGAFSPNGDGVQDSMPFTLRVSDTNGMERWTFTIANRAGKTVFQREGTRNVESAISWNGRDATGTLAPDGEYSFQLLVRYDSGKEAASPKKSFFLDTLPPDVNVAVEYHAFSPNGDGVRETITFKHTRNPGKDETFTATIKNASGKTVQRYEFGQTLPLTLEWNGTDSAGKPLPNGLYSYALEATDLAMNKTTVTVPNIRLIRDTETVLLKPASTHFAPNAALFKAPVTVSRAEGLEGWTFTVTDANKKTVKTIKGTATAPKEIVWDGTADNGKIVADGAYTGTLTLSFDSGNAPEAVTPIVVDTKGPTARLVVSPKIFSPDGDGENDTLFINLDVSDISGVDSWELNIYPYTDKKLGSSPFKTFKGTGAFKDLIQWNGYGNDAPRNTKDDRFLVESASDYAIVVTTKDKLGNVTTTAPEPFYVDILVIKTDNGYLIRISSIQFDTGKADIKPRYESILTRLGQILNRHKQHTVRIEGHTDTTGSETSNQKLSEARAQSVYRYLVSLGLDSSRFKIVGMGEARPLIEEKEPNIEDKRARNRRVEFYLERSR